jgi:hypothetical protein
MDTKGRNMTEGRREHRIMKGRKNDDGRNEGKE